ALEDGARPAEADVADELLPDEPGDVVVRLGAKARTRPRLRDSPDPRRRRPVSLAEVDELPAVVVHVSRRDHRSPETSGHADRNALLTEDGSDPVGAAEPVLDRKDDGVRTDERLRCNCGRFDVHR